MAYLVKFSDNSEFEADSLFEAGLFAIDEIEWAGKELAAIIYKDNKPIRKVFKNGSIATVDCI